MPLRLGILKRRVAGIFLITVGALALSAPLAAGRWSLAILGIALIALSAVEAYAAFNSPQSSEVRSYLPSALALLAGNVLLISSSLVFSGLLFLLMGTLAASAFSKIVRTWRKSSSVWAPDIVNGLLDFGCAALLWYLSRTIGTGQAVGIIIGVYIAAAGWRMLMAPPDAARSEPSAAGLSAHPDSKLRLSPNETFARLRAEA